MRFDVFGFRTLVLILLALVRAGLGPLALFLGVAGQKKSPASRCFAQKMIFIPDLLCRFVQNCRWLQCSPVPVQPVVFLECLSSGLCSQCCKEFQGAF